MNNTELALQFDLQYNNLSTDQAPPLDAFEVSSLLTKAQLQIIKNYFNPLGNKYREGIDDSTKRQTDLSNLIKVVILNKINLTGFSSNSSVFKLPDDYFLMLNERAGDLIVSPISYSEYQRILLKPYSEPLKKQAWRLNMDDSNVEIIGHSGDTIDTYIIRYVRRPKPIILEDLPEGLSIEGISVSTECELNDEVQHEIIDRAVMLAKAYYNNGDLNSDIAVNQTNE